MGLPPWLPPTQPDVKLYTDYSDFDAKFGANRVQNSREEGGQMDSKLKL